MRETLSLHKKHKKDGAVARKMETAFTVLCLLFSIFFIWQSIQISEPPRNIRFGPRTFPLMVGSMMLAISTALVWQHLRRVFTMTFDTSQDPQAVVMPLEEDETSISDWPAVWSVIGSLLGLFLLLERLGFVATISLFLFGLSTLFGPRRWLLNLVTSLAFCLIVYYLFTRILDIPLPNGVLNFLF